tara:strand:+ start:6411 stop:7706 length:1296 start_codon:yes stop_codon:yes gene_type:complete
VFELISGFVKKYNKSPTLDSLEISLQDLTLPENLFKDCSDLIKNLKQDTNENIEWLTERTESFCKDKAVYNAILRSISIIDGKDKQLSKEGIPDILQEALSTCFDSSVGHDYIDDAGARFDFYNHKEDKIPFDLEYFNKITDGGLPNKTLNVIMAGTGVGKSMFMCHMASNCLTQGKNVLYITMEMAEERIAERIDANCLNLDIKQIKDLPKTMFNNRINKYAEKTNGKLIVKEYPTASAHTGHFKSLLNELNLKREFKPDIIFIDYLNICASSRFKPGSNVNSYTYIKAIAEELRGLAVEYSLPVVSATQTTRSGYASTDVDLTDTSESFGLPATADFMFALMSNEDLEQMNQLMVKQLKNRYNDPTLFKRFVIGVDREKMRLYDVENAAQSNIVDSGVELDDNKLTDMSFKKLFDKNGNNQPDYSGIKV